MSLYDHGYGKEWTDVCVYRREGYTSSVADFHKHEYYEINLIFSGNIRILLAEKGVETNLSHIVLTAPGVPHFIACRPDTLYRRQYLCFSGAFMEQGSPEWEQLRKVFGRGGRILSVSESQRQLCEHIIDRIRTEQDGLLQRLLILYLLSYIGDMSRENVLEATPTPPCVVDALCYINRHYEEKIVAAELAQKLQIGRTTLMTAFREHTGTSLGTYIIQYRLKQALRLLRDGCTVQETAERCGFGESGGLIRNFKRVYGTTPGKFLQQENL